jgi:bifunctional N-acetylglucosamine-1-phosphate-uridyltransferase/glucosamine-1-phosphate-acetyltransferase GlmU-like protein
MQTKIVVLAAGRGTRMGADVPKPLVEVSGQPMVLHLIENIHASGIDDEPVLVIAPDGVEAFGDMCSDKRCRYAIQEEQLGTGHAVRSAEDAVGEVDSVIVLYGDHPFISAEVLMKLKELHEHSSSVISILTAKVPNFDGDYVNFLKWGRIIRDDLSAVQAIREYKDATEEEQAITEVNPGIYMFDRSWLFEHLNEISNDNASEEYYLTDLAEIAIEEGHAIATAEASNPFEVMGVNTPEERDRAERLMG